MFDLKLEEDIYTLTIDMNHMPMNVINRDFLEQFEKSVASVLSYEKARGLIITSGREEFIAGADLELITTVKTIEECKGLTDRLHGVFRKLETWGKPVVAAINGTALGGGYEVALACHHRIAMKNPRSQIGLPEVKLGLLPGGGGTQKLPRMLGIQNSLQFLLEGKTLNPEKALEKGLVDDLANNREEMIAKAKGWIADNPEATQPWDGKRFKLPGGAVQSPIGYQVIPASTAMVTEKTWGNYPAPRKILNCVYQGLQVPMDQALKIEAAYFAELVLSIEARHMIRTLFYSMNECNKGAARPDVPKRNINKVGILGAGMMGAGIAYSTAKAGIPCVLKDITIEAAEKGKDYSRKLLDKAISRGRMTEEKKEAILALITPTVDPKGVEGSDLVIEAVIEDRSIKAAVTHESEAVMADDAIFASNTSTLPITGLAKESKRPENFIGLHFFSPVDKMPLVEIIMGEKTSPEALAMCIDYTQKIKKTPIVVNDGRGFYTSRVFTTYVIEGMLLLSEGVAPALIDNAGKMAGMPVGPLAVADEVSLDLMYHILKQTAADLGEDAVNPIAYAMADKFVNDLARLGRKSGQGFYEYPEGGQKYLSPELAKLYPLAATQPSLEEVKKRLLHIQAIETIRCMEDDVLTTPRDADVGSILGWGFPPYTGGVISYVEMCGIDNFIKEAEALTTEFGDRFKVPQKLRELSEKKQSFYD